MQEGSSLWTCDPLVLEVEAAAEATEGMCRCYVEDGRQEVMELMSWTEGGCLSGGIGERADEPGMENETSLLRCGRVSMTL